MSSMVDIGQLEHDLMNLKVTGNKKKRKIIPSKERSDKKIKYSFLRVFYITLPVLLISILPFLSIYERLNLNQLNRFFSHRTQQPRYWQNTTFNLLQMINPDIGIPRWLSQFVTSFSACVKLEITHTCLEPYLLELLTSLKSVKSLSVQGISVPCLKQIYFVNHVELNSLKLVEYSIEDIFDILQTAKPHLDRYWIHLEIEKPQLPIKSHLLQLDDEWSSLFQTKLKHLISIKFNGYCGLFSKSLTSLFKMSQLKHLYLKNQLNHTNAYFIYPELNDKDCSLVKITFEHTVYNKKDWKELIPMMYHQIQFCFKS